MKLGFVANATQRIATNRSMPTQHVEAVITYGQPAKRAQALKKVIESAPSLAQHKETHQLLLSIIDQTDNTKRVELLYAMRRKLRDLSRNRYGNIVLQRLVERLPAIQVREIAEDYRDEATDIARHMFGNHVLQKLSKNLDAADIVADSISQDTAMLAVHPIGQHVIAGLVSSGIKPIIATVGDAAFTPDLFAMQESAVLTALLKSPHVDDDDQARLRSVLHSQAAALMAEKKQYFALIAAVEAAPADELAAWIKLAQDSAATLAQEKGQAAFLAAVIRRAGAKQREQLIAAALSAFPSPVDAACHAYGSLIVREGLSAGSVALSKKAIAALVAAADKLATSPAGVVVLQLLVVLNNESSEAVVRTIVPLTNALITDKAGSHALQAVMDHGSAEAKAQVAQVVLENIEDSICDQQGTYVIQKALRVATPEILTGACKVVATKAVEAAFNQAGCFAVAAALNAALAADQKDGWKPIMDVLKPLVAKLAVQPWTGNVVLEAMFKVASPELQKAIREVIFMKCEMFLTEPATSVEDGRGNAREEGADGQRQRRPRSTSAPPRPKRQPLAGE
jgi:hypothetical protein